MTKQRLIEEHEQLVVVLNRIVTDYDKGAIDPASILVAKELIASLGTGVLRDLHKGCKR